MVPPQVAQWVKRTYPKPQVDPEWLEGCYSWIESEFQLNPTKREGLDAILYNVDSQLLQSNLNDSMLAGTGLPHNIAEQDNITLRGPPVLVEIVSITEIGHSAFSLQNVRQARLERADLAGLAEEEENQDEEGGAVPNYPRGMLKFQISDGSTVMDAIEYRRIPEFQLGETPLGFKLQLKDVLIRRGIAFLEPAKIIMKGYQTEDRQNMQDADFVQSLRDRLGLGDEPDNNDNRPAAPAANQPPLPPPPARNPPPAPARRSPSPRPAVPRQAPRSPLQELDKPPEPIVSGPSRALHEDDEELPRRRKVPARSRIESPPSSETPTNSTVSSRYFTADSGSGKGKAREVLLSREFRLSPHVGQGPVVVPDSESDEEKIASPPRRPPAFKGKDAPPVTVHPDPDADVPAKDQSQYSSDYEFEFDANEDFLSQVEKAEKEALSGTAATSTTPTLVASTSTSTHVTKRETSVASATQTSHTLRGSLPPRNRAQRTPPVVDLGTIVIDDDDDADGKENVPVPTRHVRRRMAASQPPPEDIIEISD